MTINMKEDNKRIVMGVILVLCLALLLFVFYLIGAKVTESQYSNRHQHIGPYVREEPKIAHEHTEIRVVPKTRDTDPDVSYQRHYVAEIDGRQYNIPVDTKVTGSQSSITIIDSTLDVSPLLADKLERKRRWEIGTGIGIREDRHYYVPVAIQRNLNNRSAVELQVNIEHKGVKGGQIMYKWRL